MRPVADRDEYLAAPFGCYCAGQGFLHFFFDETLCGTVFWGRPDVAAVRQLVGLIDAELPRYSPPHSALVDTRRLTGIDEEAFRLLSGFLGERAVSVKAGVPRFVPGESGCSAEPKQTALAPGSPSATA